MPELPDLVHIAEVIGRRVIGVRITDVSVGDPVVLRLMAAVPFPDALRGKSISEVVRRGHFLRFAIDGGNLVLVVNAMLAGRFILAPPGVRKTAKATILALTFADGQELRYLDEMRMGKIYLATTAQEQDIPVYRDLGVDLLSADFTLDRFRELISGRRDQVRQFLLDKSALASIGNAYADEILFAARIHPKTFCHRLPAPAIDRLYQAVRDTISSAIRTIRERGEPIEDKVRDFLAVRGKAHRPCPNCGTAIRMVRVGRSDACFCPRCQPADRKLFVDFRNVP